MFRVIWSVPGLPVLFPAQTYREYWIGIPFTYLSRGSLTPGSPGPYYYMPKLYLDNLSAVLGGLLFWGFPKAFCTTNVTAERFTIFDTAGQRVTGLDWQAGHEEFRPIAEYPLFEPVRKMLSQPNISMLPAAAGPFFVRSDYEYDWDMAMLRPLRGAVEVDLSYVPGYECKRYPDNGWFPGIDEAILGSYVLRSPWRLSIPYPPSMAVRGNQL